MSRLRLLGLALIAVFAMSVVAASAASAAAPEFFHCTKVAKGTGTYPTKKACEKKEKAGEEPKEWIIEKVAAGEKIKFTDASGEGILSAAGIVVTCTADSSTGEINGAKTVGNVFVSFTGCTAKNGETECSVHSTGQPAGTIDTNELAGELGPVALAESKTEVGLDLEAVSGNFVTLEGTCVPTTEVTGSVIGEVTPVEKLQKTGKLVYTTKTGKQKIQKFVGGATDVLKAFGLVEVQETTKDTVTYEESIEVT